MNLLVVYFSETGNTEMVARAIHDEVSKHYDARLEEVKVITTNELNEFDLVFLGSACHSADLAVPVKRLLDDLPRSPRFKLAGFFTCAATQETVSEYAGKCLVSFETACKEKKIDFLGCFNCQGNPSPELTKSMLAGGAPLSDTELEAYFEEVKKHPNPEDLQNAKDFAKKILQKFG